MFYSLRGILIHMEQNMAVVECGGVGYKCLTTINTQKTLKLNTEVFLYTHLNIREDAAELYGFATQTELSAFKTLIGVSGVGPKAGIAVLSVLTPQQIALAIASNDLKSITMAPGVGKKLAQRIVLELKDKLKGIETSDSDFSVEAVENVRSGNVPKAIEALSVLGYAAAEVTPVLASFDPDLPVEKLIGETLKQMGRN